MNTLGAQIPGEERVGSRFGGSFYVTVAIFAACLSTVVYSTLFLGGTLFGFALAFGGGVIALECVVVFRKMFGGRRDQADYERAYQ